MIVPFFIQKIYAIIPKVKFKYTDKTRPNRGFNPGALQTYLDENPDYKTLWYAESPYWKQLTPMARTTVDRKRLINGHRNCLCNRHTLPLYKMDTLDGSLYLTCKHGKKLNAHSYDTF